MTAVGPIDPTANAAWEALYRRCSHMVYDYAMRLTQGNPGRSEDLMQDTFIAAYKKWDDVGKRAPIAQENWLRFVARKKFLDLVRLDSRFEPLTDLIADTLQVPDGFCEQVMGRAALRRCWQIMIQMPKQRFLVAYFSWLRGLKNKEVANLLGIKPVTVAVHLLHARRDIEKEVGPHMLPFSLKRLDEPGPGSNQEDTGTES